LDFLYWLFVSGPDELEIIPTVLGWMIPAFSVLMCIIPSIIENKFVVLCAIPASWIAAFAIYCLKLYEEDNK